MSVRSGFVLLRLVALVCLAAPGWVVVSASAADGGSFRERAFGLADVRTIFVADLGGSVAATATRDAVIHALRTVGFVTVERAEEADGVLGGRIVTRRVEGEPVVVFKSAVLHARSGEALWHLRLRSARSPHKQAGRLARALRAGVEQAVWNAAREVP